MTNPKLVRIDLRIDLETRRQLKAILAEEGDTISAFIRRAIEERLANQ